MFRRFISSGRTKGLLLAASVLAISPIHHALAQGDTVVARVNGAEITRADIAVAEEMYGQQLADMPEDARLSVLTDLLIDTQLAADAGRAASLQDEEAFKRRLAFFENQTLRSALIEREIAKRVDDAAVRAAYDAQVASTPPVTESRISHILVATQAEAQEIIDALGSGTDFATLARERSLDRASGENGGDLGFFDENSSIAEIEKAASALQPGQVTEEPVATPFGFHVVRLDERRQKAAPALEAVAPQTRQALESQAAAAIMAELRSAASVEKLVPNVQPPEQDDGHEH